MEVPNKSLYSLLLKSSREILFFFLVLHEMSLINKSSSAIQVCMCHTVGIRATAPTVPLALLPFLWVWGKKMEGGLCSHLNAVLNQGCSGLGCPGAHQMASLGGRQLNTDHERWSWMWGSGDIK